MAASIDGTSDWSATVDDFVHRLRSIVVGYHDPRRNSEVGQELSVQYGNIRFEVFPAEAGKNIGLIYETPNGSTNQIQISCNTEARSFAIPLLDALGENEVRDVSAAMGMVQQHVDSIPRQRRERLRDYIDSWVDQGKKLGEIVDKLNHMVQQEMKGGRITYKELSEACRYAVNRLGM